MHKLILLAVLALILGACSSPSGTVSPGDGPRATPGASGPDEDMPEPEVVEGEGLDGEESKEATFSDKIVFDSGVEFEVIKIEKAKLGEYEAYGDDQKTGDPYYVFSLRFTNGTNASVDVDLVNVAVSSGPDGEIAESVGTDKTKSMSGTVPVGKSRTGTYGFTVADPSDVVMEVSLSGEDASARALFMGGIE